MRFNGNNQANQGNQEQEDWEVSTETAHIILVAENETFAVNNDTLFNNMNVIFGLASGATLEIYNTRLVPTKITINMKNGSLFNIHDTDFVSTEIICNMDVGARVLINNEETIAQEDQSMLLQWLDDEDVENIGDNMHIME